MKKYLIIGVFLCGLVISCGKEKEYNYKPEPKPSAVGYEFKNIKEIFGFYGQQRYSYCPSIVKEDNDTVHVFFCGTQNMVMVDNIYHIRINPDSSQTPAKIVLQPGSPGAWDDHHTCDPSVIKGNFSMGGNSYQYAMFYLSNMYGVYYNEIGVAFSNDLEAGHWVKYPNQVVRKTWSYDGDQEIGGGGQSWGVGQPSAVSLDKQGRVLLTYTIGDLDGTRIAWAEIDCSNMDNFSGITASTTMIKTGLSNIDYTGTDVTNNSDFAINQTENKIVMARSVHPNPSIYPTHIEEAVEVDYMPLDGFLQSTGEWTPIMRITPAISGYPRNHNPGIERNAYGEIENWREPVIYYTVSLAAPDVEPSGTKFAEWTYHIWRGDEVKISNN
jgi:hypothetical protein